MAEDKQDQETSEKAQEAQFQGKNEKNYDLEAATDEVNNAD